MSTVREPLERVRDFEKKQFVFLPIPEELCLPLQRLPLGAWTISAKLAMLIVREAQANGLLNEKEPIWIQVPPWPVVINKNTAGNCEVDAWMPKS